MFKLFQLTSTCHIVWKLHWFSKLCLEHCPTEHARIKSKYFVFHNLRKTTHFHVEWRIHVIFDSGFYIQWFVQRQVIHDKTDFSRLRKLCVVFYSTLISKQEMQLKNGPVSWNVDNFEDFEGCDQIAIW